MTFSAAGPRRPPGSHEVKVQVTDPDGASAIDGATVEVKNVAPSVVKSPSLPRIYKCDNPYSLLLSPTSEPLSAAPKNPPLF